MSRKYLLVAGLFLLVAAVAFAFQNPLRQGYYLGPVGGNDAHIGLTYTEETAGATLNVAFTTSDTLEYTMDASTLWISSNTLAFEGSTADAYETILASADVAQDTTWTFPDATSGAVTVGDTTATFAFGGAFADHIDSNIFIADRAYVITGINVTWGVAESTGAMDVMVEKLVGVTACGSGTDTMSAAIDATATADTTTAASLHGTAGNYALAAGDTLCVDLTAAPHEIANLVVVVALEVN